MRLCNDRKRQEYYRAYVPTAKGDGGYHRRGCTRDCDLSEVLASSKSTVWSLIVARKRRYYQAEAMGGHVLCLHTCRQTFIAGLAFSINT